MRQSADKEEMQKDLLLEQCFNCLVSTGLEGVSIREFQNATGMTASSLYYWFSDKDEIVLDAVGFGINKIVISQGLHTHSSLSRITHNMRKQIFKWCGSMGSKQKLQQNCL